MTRAPPNNRRHSTVRTHTRARARERAGEQASGRAGSPLSPTDTRVSPLGLCTCTHVATPPAILRPEYMTRSTRINWHYGYDAVSLATVTRASRPLPGDLAACPSAPRHGSSVRPPGLYFLARR